MSTPLFRQTESSSSSNTSGNASQYRSLRERYGNKNEFNLKDIEDGAVVKGVLESGVLGGVL